LTPGQLDKLTLLEPQPLINFSSTPECYTCGESVCCDWNFNLGSLPVYIQTPLWTAKAHHRLRPPTERRSSVPYRWTPMKSSSSSDMAPPSTVASSARLHGGSVWQLHTHHTLRPPQQSTSSLGRVPATSARLIRSTGALLMLDPARPYPTSHLVPRLLGVWTAKGTGPAVTDELGTPTGMYIEIGSELRRRLTFAGGGPGFPKHGGSHGAA